MTDKPPLLAGVRLDALVLFKAYESLGARWLGAERIRLKALQHSIAVTADRMAAKLETIRKGRTGARRRLLSLLERRTAVVTKKRHANGDTWHWECGACRVVVSKWPRHLYCPTCGAALEWRLEE